MSLGITVVGGINHMPVPQRIVCQDKSSRTQDRKRHFVSLTVGPLIPVNKGHIECHAQTGSLRYSITNDKTDFVADG